MGYQKPNRLMLASEGFPEHLLLLCSWKLLQSVEPQAADLVYGATGNKPYQNHLDLKRYSCILEIVGVDDSAIPRMKGPRFRLKNWNWVRSILSIFLHFLIWIRRCTTIMPEDSLTFCHTARNGTTKGTTIHHTPPAGAICPADGLKLIYRCGWFGGFNPGEV